MDPPACDEPFGRELRVERLRVERLSRIEANHKYSIFNLQYSIPACPG